MKKQMRGRIAIFTAGMLLFGFAGVLSGMAHAEEADGVAGCNAVVVDPSASLEVQQAVCSGAEALPQSSCAASGHGHCSSPKTNDVMVDGNHCVCVSDDAAADTTGETL